MVHIHIPSNWGTKCITDLTIDTIGLYLACMLATRPRTMPPCRYHIDDGAVKALTK